MSNPLKQQLVDLQHEYLVVTKELHVLAKEIAKLEQRIRQGCEHDWQVDDSERGGRTYHSCIKCGMFR